MVISDGGDFYLKVPSSRNEASATQLELHKEYQLKSGSMDQFAVDWLIAACHPQQSALLFLTFDTDSIADVALTAAQKYLENNTALSKTVYPKVQIKDKTYQCVDDSFSNMSFGQFLAAEEQLFLYYARKDYAHLLRLTLALYKIPGTDFDHGQLYSLFKKFNNKFSEIQLLINLDFYQGCRKQLEAKYKHTFPKPTEGKEKGEIKPASIKKMIEGYHAKLVQFAKTPEKKKLMYHENVWTVLEFIETDLVQYKSFKSLNL